MTRDKQEPSILRVLVKEWRWIFGGAVLLAIPTYGFTIPFHWAVIAHALAVLFYICTLLMFGSGHVIEGIFPVIIAVVLFAMLSHSLQTAKEKQERREQQRQMQKVSP